MIASDHHDLPRSTPPMNLLYATMELGQSTIRVDPSFCFILTGLEMSGSLMVDSALTIFLSIHTVTKMFPVLKVYPSEINRKILCVVRMVPQAYTFCWRREENRSTEVKNLSQKIW